MRLITRDEALAKSKKERSDNGKLILSGVLLSASAIMYSLLGIESLTVICLLLIGFPMFMINCSDESLS